jgi:hypothetical protein
MRRGILSRTRAEQSGKFYKLKKRNENKFDESRRQIAMISNPEWLFHCPQTLLFQMIAFEDVDGP